MVVLQGITMWVFILATLLPGKKMKLRQPDAAVAPTGYVPIEDDPSVPQRTGAAGCAVRMRSVLEVVAAVQIALLAVATVSVAVMNHRADG